MDLLLCCCWMVVAPGNLRKAPESFLFLQFVDHFHFILLSSISEGLFEFMVNLSNETHASYSFSCQLGHCSTWRVGNAWFRQGCSSGDFGCFAPCSAGWCCSAVQEVVAKSLKSWGHFHQGPEFQMLASWWRTFLWFWVSFLQLTSCIRKWIWSCRAASTASSDRTSRSCHVFIGCSVVQSWKCCLSWLLQNARCHQFGNVLSVIWPRHWHYYGSWHAGLKPQIELLQLILCLSVLLLLHHRLCLLLVFVFIFLFYSNSCSNSSPSRIFLIFWIDHQIHDLMTILFWFILTSWIFQLVSFAYYWITISLYSISWNWHLNWRLLQDFYPMYVHHFYPVTPILIAPTCFIITWEIV